MMNFDVEYTKTKPIRLTKTGKELIRRLTEIFDDPYFRIAIYHMLYTDKRKQILIDELDAGLRDVMLIVMHAKEILVGKRTKPCVERYYIHM